MRTPDNQATDNANESLFFLNPLRQSQINKAVRDMELYAYEAEKREKEEKLKKQREEEQTGTVVIHHPLESPKARTAGEELLQLFIPPSEPKDKNDKGDPSASKEKNNVIATVSEEEVIVEPLQSILSKKELKITKTPQSLFYSPCCSMNRTDFGKGMVAAGIGIAIAGALATGLLSPFGVIPLMLGIILIIVGVVCINGSTCQNPYITPHLNTPMP